jgi:L-alanine-DL-glutamate epimerase-like enolase superfamily enzyme
MGLLDDLWVAPPRIENGVLFAPETPGHGLAFRPEVLAELAH